MTVVPLEEGWEYLCRHALRRAWRLTCMNQMWIKNPQSARDIRTAGGDPVAIHLTLGPLGPQDSQNS